MPRPAAHSYLAGSILLILLFVPLTAINTAASQTPPPGGVASRQALAGIWVLDRDRGDLAHPESVPDGSARGRRGRGGAGRYGGGGPGMGAGQSPQDFAARRLAIMNYIRDASEASKEMTIVVRDDTVEITDADGRVEVLRTDDKKVEGRAGNGLIKLSTKNRWDGNTLRAEATVETDLQIIRTFALSPGGTELRLTTTIDSGGPPTSLLRFYGRPVESR